MVPCQPNLYFFLRPFIQQTTMRKLQEENLDVVILRSKAMREDIEYSLLMDVASPRSAPAPGPPLLIPLASSSLHLLHLGN
jgi:hypothetical protein